MTTANLINPAHVEANQVVDPTLERAMFFAEMEWAELVAVVPQAEPVQAKFVY